MEVPESRERHSSLALSYKGAEIERSIPQTKTSDLASKQIRIVGSSRCVRRIAMGLQLFKPTSRRFVNLPTFGLILQGGLILDVATCPTQPGLIADLQIERLPREVVS